MDMSRTRQVPRAGAAVGASAYGTRRMDMSRTRQVPRAGAAVGAIASCSRATSAGVASESRAPDHIATGTLKPAASGKSGGRVALYRRAFSA